VPTTFTHQALLYHSVDEFAQAVVPYVREGIDDEDSVVVMTNARNLEVLRRSLPPEHLAAVDLQSSMDRYARPALALTAYHEMLSEHVAAGRRVRVVGEQPLTTVPTDHVWELCRIDAAFDEVCAFPGVSVVCPYDLEALPSQVINRIRRSHQEIVHRGLRQPNRHYRRPAQLLAEDRARGDLPEAPASARELQSPRTPAQARAFVQTNASALGLDDEHLGDFLLAVGEVVANAFTHAEIDQVRIWHDQDRLVCEVRDHGVGLRDLLVGYRQPNLDGISGRGMWLAHQLTDLVEVHTGPTGTTVRLHLSTVRETR
jgi:anti-sigma regulatory factor (Ser/Thr protein kinase)